MNHTTEDSKQNAILVGGETYALENGKIEMPPEHAKTTKTIIENIEQGNFMTISIGKCKAEDILSKKDIAKLLKVRNARKTRSALNRRGKEEVK